MEMAVTTGLTNKNALTSESHNFLARDWIAGLERGLGVIEAFGMHFTNPSLKALLSYVVFIGVLLFRPKGLFSK